MMFDDIVIGPVALAFLVNESRARLPEISGDHIARLWARKPMDAAIADLWADFSKTVYPNDDIELSVRNRYFLRQLNGFFQDKPGVFLNIASGLTSYPYYLSKKVECIEFDLEVVMEFKKLRSMQLESIKELEKRIIKYIKIDFRQQSFEQITREIASSSAPKAVLLEGISYYLPPNTWKGLIDSIRAVVRPCDILLIDFWHKKDCRKVVFDRFRQFLNRHDAYDLRNFNFIDLVEGDVYRGYKVVKVTDVFEQEAHIRSRRSLREGSPAVLPERYAMLVALQ